MTHDVQLVISAMLCGGMLASATFIWRSDGPLMNAFAIMLTGISLEILFAIGAERYLDNAKVFDNIKITGRILEAIGIGWFLWCISRARIALPISSVPIPDEGPEPPQ